MRSARICISVNVVSAIFQKASRVSARQDYLSYSVISSDYEKFYPMSSIMVEWDSSVISVVAWRTTRTVKSYPPSYFDYKI